MSLDVLDFWFDEKKLMSLANNYDLKKILIQFLLDKLQTIGTIDLKL